MRKKKSKPLIGKEESLNPISIKIISGDPELDNHCDQIWENLEATTKATKESAKAEMQRLEQDIETYGVVIETLEAKQKSLNELELINSQKKERSEIIKEAIKCVFQNRPTLHKNLHNAWRFIHEVNLQGYSFETQGQQLFVKNETGEVEFTYAKKSLERLV